MLLKCEFRFSIKLTLLMLVQNAFNIVEAEFYSSIHEMSRLVEYEGIFLRNMQKFITVNENKLDFLRARLDDFERDRDEARLEGSAYFDSPLNRYLLTKRLTVDWERIENLMEHNSGKKSLNNIERCRNENPFPDNAELDGAIEGFLRIQDIYRLNTTDMAAGVLRGVKYDTEMEARHCFDIAQFALRNNLLRFAHSWITEALKRFSSESDARTSSPIEERSDEAQMLAILAESKHKLGDLKGANVTYAALVQLKPENETYAKAYTQFLQDNEAKEFTSLEFIADHEPLPADLLTTDQSSRYKHTCNGLINQSPTEERELRCGYLTETHPFLLIAPIKTEELNHDPLLVVFYDVISDNEIAIVQQLTNHKVERARVMNFSDSIISPARTSQFAFLSKTVHQVLQNIDRRVEDMTNLNMHYAEDHQFANYGIGGHYAEHTDWFDLTTQVIAGSEMGNRIATVLFYLSDVEQGGGTAFPYLKRLLLPKKGAAAFWYNLHASGVGDRRSLHGACPIIVGSKWVQNRWIREYIQSDRRPCEVFDDQFYGVL